MAKQCAHAAQHALSHSSSWDRCDGFVKESLASALLEFVKLQVVARLVIVFVMLVDVVAGGVGGVPLVTIINIVVFHAQPLHQAAVLLVTRDIT